MSKITIIKVEECEISTAAVVSIIMWNQDQINWSKQHDKKPSPHNIDAVWGMKKLLKQMAARGADVSGVPDYLLGGNNHAR